MCIYVYEFIYIYIYVYVGTHLYVGTHSHPLQQYQWDRIDRALLFLQRFFHLFSIINLENAVVINQQISDLRQ